MLLAAFYLLVHCYSGQSDLIVGTFSPAGRKRLEVQHLLGYFLNPVAVRVILSDNPTFIELLHRAGSATSEAISNDDVPFEDVVRELTPTADPDDNSYFSVALSLQPRAPDLGVSWTVTSMDAESGGAKLDLYLAFIELADQLHVRVQYNADVFEYAEIEKLVDDFQSILQICVARPNTRVSEMPIIKANR
jgi:non-ribosomal peptide synthetase component F